MDKVIIMGSSAGANMTLDNAEAAYPITRGNLEKCAARIVEMTWRITAQK